MPILNWYHARISGAKPSFPAQYQLPSLSVEQALNAHINWLDNWKSKVANKDPSAYDIPTISSDSHCEFGQWLRAAHNTFRHHEEFQALCDAHQAFHHKAGEIAELHKNQKFTQSLQLMREELPQCSLKVAEKVQKLCEVYHR